MLAVLVWSLLLWLSIGATVSLLADPDRQFMKQAGASRGAAVCIVELIVVLLWPMLLYYLWRESRGR